MVNMVDIVVSEILCYITNNYAKATKNGVVTTVCGFYTEEEIVLAKDRLFEVVKQLRIDGVLSSDAVKHHNVTRSQGDQKRRRETADLVAVFADLDALKVGLPVFVAANLQQIPPFSADATDFCTLAFNVNQLQTQMAQLEQRLNDQSAGVSAQSQVANDVVNVANSIVQEDDGAMAASRDVTDENTAMSLHLLPPRTLTWCLV